MGQGQLLIEREDETGPVEVNQPPVGGFDPLPTPTSRAGQLPTTTPFYPNGWNESLAANQPPLGASGFPEAAPPTIRGKFTRGMWVSVVVASTLVTGSIGGGIAMHVERNRVNNETLGPPPGEVTASYLDALIARDLPAQRALESDYNRRNISTEGRDRLVGTKIAADAINLKMSYEIIATEYKTGGDRLWTSENSNHAEVLVKLNYSVTVNGKRANAWGLQVVTLHRSTRIFNNSGIYSPNGKWKVDDVDGHNDLLSDAEIIELSGSSTASGTDLTVQTYTEGCFIPSFVVAELSEEVVASGKLPTSCIINENVQAVADHKTIEFLQAEMTAVDSSQLPGIVNFGLVRFDDDKSVSPMEQVAVPIADREFIFTLFSINQLDPKSRGYDRYRIISIVERTES